jgi:hypothetical protein
MAHCILTNCWDRLGVHQISWNTRKELTMRMTRIAVAVLLVGVAAHSLSAERRHGKVKITKECSHNTGGPGSYCTITSSNVAEIPAGSTVYYTEGAVNATTSEGSVLALDSNVVLFVTTGDWATGRCTLGTAFSGLCTFSDGVGALAGFHGRVAVAPTGGFNFSWTGTYAFDADDDE